MGVDDADGDVLIGYVGMHLIAVSYTHLQRLQPLGCRRKHQRNRHTRQIFYDLLHRTHSFFFLCLYLIAAL